MNRKELIEQLLGDHMNDSVYAVIYDSNGEARYFSLDEVEVRTLGKFTKAPALVLRDDKEN